MGYIIFGMSRIDRLRHTIDAMIVSAVKDTNVRDGERYCEDRSQWQCQSIFYPISSTYFCAIQ
jgi:hypothetical protein